MTSASIGHLTVLSGERKTVLIQFPQSINEENQQNIFQYEIYGTFSRKSRHSTLTVNATVLTRFSVEELTLKQLLTMKSEYRVCRAQN